jgi:hypothetical protein
MTNWKLFWKNLKALAHALATEESICITPSVIPKRNITKREVKDLIAKATKKVRVNKKENNEKPEIQWPKGELTFKELCQANVNFSKEELHKAIGKKMEQSRKVLT